MSKQTCSWCGKQYDTDKFQGLDYFATQKITRNYCSKRCALAGEKQHEKEVEEAGGPWQYFKKKALYYTVLVIISFIVMYFVGKSMS